MTASCAGRHARHLILSALLWGGGGGDAMAANEFGYDGTCFNTLADAIDAADLAVDVYANIWIKPGTYALGDEVVWTHHRTVKPGNATCDGPATSGTVLLNAHSTDRAFRIDDSATLVMHDISLFSGDPLTGAGGTIQLGDNAGLYMFNGTLSYGNTINENGGCLATGTNATVELYDVTVELCTADGAGGGLYLGEGTFAFLSDVTIEDNDAVSGGGGVAIVGGSFVYVVGSSIVEDNEAGTGGGISLLYGDEGDTTLILQDTTTVTGNSAGAGGGIWASRALETTREIRLEDSASVLGNEATTGGGFYLVGDGEAMLVNLEDDASIVGNEASGNGGGIMAYGAGITMTDRVLVAENVSGGQGGAVNLVSISGAPDSTLDIAGELVAATGVITGETQSGVRFEDNSAVDGSAVYSIDAHTVADSLVVQGHDSTAVVAVRTGAVGGGSSFTANRSHFNQNAAVFRIGETSTLLVQAEYGVAGCDTLNTALFDPDRYCSEIYANTGQLINTQSGSDVTILTTAIMSNDLTTPTVAVEVENGADVTFVTNMVGNNFSNSTTADTLVDVHSGGNFVGKQSTFADVDLPIRYRGGSTGDFRRNAAYDSGSGVAVIVAGTATVTGNQNIGDKSGTVTFVTGTPGWVTTSRGDFHLDITSPAVDMVTIDGGFDVEGTVRPQPAADWDAGAIELAQP